MGKIYIGTSGWVYKAWHKKFYPPEIKKDFLPYYSRYFNTVEINNSFYHLPPPHNFDKWRRETGTGFIFATKLSRAITHSKRLVDAGEYTRRFLQNYSALDTRRGPILVQLPPSFKYDLPRVRSYFAEAKTIAKELGLRGTRFALELRHPSWYLEDNEKQLLIALKNLSVAPVIADSGKFPEFDPDMEIKGKFVYVRMHGPEDFAASPYAEKRLRPWAERIRRWREKDKDVYLYFNNDVHGYAIEDARILLSLL